MSAKLSARRQKHPRSEHVPVSVIAVNSSPPPPSTTKESPHSREIFGIACRPDPYSSSTGRHRNASAGWHERPVSVDVWMPTSDDGTMKRSVSATLSNDARDCRAQSSMLQSPQSGSTHHLGSSVTFCNAVAAGRVNASVDLNLDDEVGMRRSSSLNHTADVVLRPSGTPTTSARGTQQQKQQQQQQQQPRGKLGLTLPVITCDGVTSVPTSPLRHIRSDVTGFGSTRQLHPGTMSLGGGSRVGGSSRTILVTPQGSFLSVNQSPIEFRESTVSISYSNGAGARSKPISLYTNVNINQSISFIIRQHGP